MRLKPILFFVIVGSLAAYIIVHQIHEGDGGVIRIGQKAPDVVLTDISGKHVNLSDYRGKLVFLNFWASWCAPCEKEMPDLQTLHNTFKDRAFQMLTVSVDVSPDAAVKFYNGHNLTMPWFSDPGRIIADKYKVNVYPETFIIDRNGHIIRHYPGPITTQTIQQIEGYMRDQEQDQISAR
jgi:peroxiredoxin